MNAWMELGEAFKSVFKPNMNRKFSSNYKQYQSQEDQFRALWNGDIDVAVMDRYLFSWFYVSQNQDVPVDQEFVVHDLFQREKYSYVAFRDQKARDAFNQEMRKMRKSGEFQAVLQQYVGTSVAAIFPDKKQN